MSHTNIGWNIATSIRDMLRSNIPDGVFDVVDSFDSGGRKRVGTGRKLGLLMVESDRVLFNFDRLYRLRLRCFYRSSVFSPENLLNFVEEVKYHLDRNRKDSGIYHGLRIDSVRFVDDFTVEQVADLFLEITWLRETPVVLGGTTLQQKLFTESIDTATLTGINHGSSVLSNLQDRDPTTLGFDNTSSSTMGVEIDFSTARTCNYVILGGLDTGGKDMTLEVFYMPITTWISLGTQVVNTNGENLYFSFSELTDRNWKIELTPTGGTGTLKIYYIFLGSEYVFPSSYDLRSAPYVLGQASDIQLQYSQDQNSALKMATQSSGVFKRFWDVTWSMSSAEGDNLAQELLHAEFNQKNFVFYDPFRGGYYLVKLQESYLRQLAIAEDFHRVRLQMSEV